MNKLITLLLLSGALYAQTPLGVSAAEYEPSVPELQALIQWLPLLADQVRDVAALGRFFTGGMEMKFWPGVIHLRLIHVSFEAFFRATGDCRTLVRVQ